VEALNVGQARKLHTQVLDVDARATRSTIARAVPRLAAPTSSPRDSIPARSASA
jgi:hypothetical protein